MEGNITLIVGHNGTIDEITKDFIKELMDFIPEDINKMAQRKDKKGVMFYSEEVQERYIVELNRIILTKPIEDFSKINTDHFLEIISHLEIKELNTLKLSFKGVNRVDFNVKEKFRNSIDDEIKNIFGDNNNPEYGIRIVYDKEGYTIDTELEPYFKGENEDLFINMTIIKQETESTKKISINKELLKDIVFFLKGEVDKLKNL